MSGRTPLHPTKFAVLRRKRGALLEADRGISMQFANCGSQSSQIF